MGKKKNDRLPGFPSPSDAPDIGLATPKDCAEPPLPKESEVIKFEGVPCDYVQFKDKPLPPAKGKEPVWELKLQSTDAKYRVDRILAGEHLLIFWAYGRSKIVPMSNVAYVQPI